MIMMDLRSYSTPKGMDLCFHCIFSACDNVFAEVEQTIFGFQDFFASSTLESK